MKVAFFVNPGIDKYTIQLANGLVDYIDVLVLQPESEDTDYSLYVRKEVQFSTYPRIANSNPRFFFVLEKAIKTIYDFRPDIIHFQSENFWMSMLLPFLRYKKVLTIHDVDSHLGEYKFRNRISKFLFRKFSDRVIVHGKYLENRLVKNKNFRKSDISIVPHGNYNFFLKSPNPEKAPSEKTVLFFGRLRQYKGLEYLIKAEPFVSKEVPEVKFLIVINGNSFQEYKKYLKNKDRFEIVEGFVPNNKVSFFFEQATIVVIPYVEASQSGILSMSYSFRKPVVATKVGCIPESVVNGKTGILVPPRDPISLAKAIIFMLKNKTLCERMGSNALRDSNTKYSWKRISQLTLEVYRSVIKA